MKDDEKDYCEPSGVSQCHTSLMRAVMYQRALSMAPESHAINWNHTKGVFYRWQQLLRSFNPLPLGGCVLTLHSGIYESLPADHGRSSLRVPPHSDQ
jgi:hypothetical protein